MLLAAAECVGWIVMRLRFNNDTAAAMVINEKGTSDRRRRPVVGVPAPVHGARRRPLAVIALEIEIDTEWWWLVEGRPVGARMLEFGFGPGAGPASLTWVGAGCVRCSAPGASLSRASCCLVVVVVV